MVVPPNAAALTMVRATGEGLVEYTVATPRLGRTQIQQVLQEAGELGFLLPPGARGTCAVLDVLDGDGDILTNYSIPDLEALGWWRGRIGLRPSTPANS